MSDTNASQIQTEKKVFTFGFSKTKPKVNLSQTEKAKAFQAESSKPESSIELIKSIEGKKVNPVNKSADDEKKKPLVIPCAGNNLVFDIKREEIRNKKAKEESEKGAGEPTIKTDPSQSSLDSNGKIDDLAAINALIADSKKKVEEKDKNDLKIPLTEAEKSAQDAIEDPNYESVDLEKFGLAALRGMGWNEKVCIKISIIPDCYKRKFLKFKSGMGLTNKRSISVYEPELRPKGLGLGAGSSKKIRPGESDDTRSGQESSSSSNLKYAKGAYVQILNGKHTDEYGQIVSFDDGLNRVIVKLASDDSSISLIQNYTKLLSKNDFMEATERRKHRK